MFKANFRTKVLVPVVVCMVTLMAVTVFVVNYLITRQFQIESVDKLAHADTAFRNLRQIHSDDLLQRFHGLVNQPIYAAFSTADAKTIQAPLNKLLKDEPDVSVVFYSTNAQSVTASQRQPDSTIPTADFTSAASAAVRLALSGKEKVDTIRVGERLYEVVAIPVYDTYNDNALVGALTLGWEVGDADALRFKQMTGNQIVLLAGGQAVASTLSNPGDATNLAGFFGDSLYADSEVKQISLKDGHYYCVVGRFPSLGGDKSLGYVLLSSYDNSVRTLQTTKAVLLWVSSCAILLGAMVVWLLVNRVTQPLRELRDSAEAVGRGDFSRRVPVRSSDECGELAVAFNRMTENVQQSRAQLEQTVTTLKTTQEQLIQSEKLSAVGEFVAGVAHELNNPLASVMGFAELLKNTNTDEKQQRHLELIFKASQRCQKIVQSLLSFARRQKPERKPASVNALIETVLELVAYPLRTSNVEVVTQLDPRLPAVLADEHQIQQVLLNVINNARQAIEAQQRGGKITISTGVNGSNVRIAIQDNGPGIPPENLRRIFDPFFTTKEVGKGTGLGLSLCYGIIKEHGGSITPMSRPGEGATFLIELPILPGADLPDAAPGSSEYVTQHLREGTGKRVLVIDDEESLLLMVQEELSRRGYDVATATDGEAGLRRLEQNHVDALICDWKMPGLNGMQVYERLRATRPDFCRRVIFVTGDVINEPMQKFLEAEQRPCLNKPFTLVELRSTLKTVLTAR